MGRGKLVDACLSCPGTQQGEGRHGGHGSHGSLKREKYLNLKNKIPGIEKSLIFVKNLNKPGIDLDQPVMFCC